MFPFSLISKLVFEWGKRGQILYGLVLAFSMSYCPNCQIFSALKNELTEIFHSFKRLGLRILIIFCNFPKKLQKSRMSSLSNFH